LPEGADAVRFLFTFAGGSGHAEPLVPLARAAQAAGHTAAFEGATSAVNSLRQRGFTAFADGQDSGRGLTKIAPLLDVDMAHEDDVLRDHYAGSSARSRLASVLTRCEQWVPDAIVCDEVDFGAMVAAEKAGIPHATVLVTAAGSFVRMELLATPLSDLRASARLAAEPQLAMLSPDLVLSPFAPSFRDPAFPLPATAHSFRAVTGGGDPAPDWLARLPPVPTIYFTLGTVFNMESGDLFTRVLAGLRDLPVNLIVTVGRELSASAFGPQPSNVHIESYLPQRHVLPHCDLVLSHGGSGTVAAALAAGLPLVVMPMGADQPANAGRCVALGVGIALDAMRSTPHDVRAAAVTVLGTPSYRAAAERVRDEVALLPGPAQMVPLLEGLVDAR